MRIEVKGLQGVQDALDELPRNLRAGVLRRVGKQALEPVAAAMRAGAPIGNGAGKQGKRRKHYRDTIGVSNKVSAKQRTFARSENDYRVNVFAGAGSGVSHLIEKGTRQRRTKNGANRGIMPARPHLLPAWTQHAPSLPQEIGRLLWAEIAKVAQRVAKRAPK